jgi:succinyl-diaminopimelate desuccinylase
VETRRDLLLDAATHDAATLTATLVDIESVSGDEEPLADAIEATLRDLPHLSVTRIGNTLLARTSLGRPERVVLAGHIDTVPVADNLPSRAEGGRLYGVGTSDMKSGVAVQLRLAATVSAPTRDITYVFYDCEEVQAERNGLGRLAASSPELLEADFAVLLEPSGGRVEGGCQGTLQVSVAVPGARAHTARSWMGSNAIHSAGQVLDLLRGYTPRRVPIDGLEYREGLNAVAISGGVAGNVVPDLCEVRINYRFAPDRSQQEAFAHIRGVFDHWEVTLVDSAPGALPGLSVPAAADFVAATGGEVAPKLGWTDVARFSQLGIPAVNYGPGISEIAHTPGEYVEIAQITNCENRLAAWLRP